MTAPLLGFLAFAAGTFAFGCLVGALIACCDACHAEVAEDQPDGTADLLADQPPEVLVDDEQVRQLERTWLL